jgi:hypothetical protein
MQYISGLQQYLVEKDGQYSPVFQTIKINEKQAVNLPIIALFNHDAVNLEEMEVAMDLTIKNMALKSTTKKSSNGDDESDADEDISRTVFAVDLNSARLEGEYSKLELKFKFKAGTVPEAISRVIDKLNGQVSVYEIQNNNNDKTEGDSK